MYKSPIRNTNLFEEQLRESLQEKASCPECNEQMAAPKQAPSFARPTRREQMPTLGKAPSVGSKKEQFGKNVSTGMGLLGSLTEPHIIMKALQAMKPKVRKRFMTGMSNPKTHKMLRTVASMPRNQQRGWLQSKLGKIARG